MLKTLQKLQKKFASQLLYFWNLSCKKMMKISEVMMYFLKFKLRRKVNFVQLVESSSNTRAWRPDFLLLNIIYYSNTYIIL